MNYRSTMLFLFLGVHELAAATLAGTVINRTTGQPAAGDQVLLLKVDSGRAAVAGRSVTDSRGRFQLTGDFPAESRGVRVIHGGVGYDKPAPAGAEEIEFHVYDATEKLEGVTAISYLERLQAEGGKLGVVDELTVSNASDPPRILAGSRPFEFHLPAGAEVIDGRMLRPGGRPATFKPMPNSQPDWYYFPAPLLPGETLFAVAYQVPYSGEANLEPKISLPLERVIIQYPKSMQFEGKVPGMFDTKPEQGELQVSEAVNLAQAPAFRVWGTGKLALIRNVRPGAPAPKLAVSGEVQVSGSARGTTPVKPGPMSQYRGYMLGAAALVLACSAAVFFAHKRRQARLRNSPIVIAAVAKSVVIGAAASAWLYAFSTGPPPARTGAPGEGTCRECHDGGAGGGKVEIAFPGQMVYSPGVKQSLTVTITDIDAQRYGFQLSVRVSADNSQAGTLNPAAGESAIRVICRDFNLRPASGCPASAPIEYIEHSSPRQTNRFSIEWTPPAADVGPVKIYVAANAANGNGSPSGDDIYTTSYTLTPQAGGPVPSISQGGVVNAWSSAATVGDATWIAIYGSNFAPAARTWRADEIIGGRLPTSLDGVSVKVNNKDAFVYYISPGQINVQTPDDPATGPVPIQVSTPNGTSNTISVDKQVTAPALFTWAGLAQGSERFVGAVSAQLKPDGTLDYIAPPGLIPGLTTRAARPGETVLVFATGCGPTSPAVPAGQVVNIPYPALAGAVNVRIDGIPAQLAGGTGFLTFAGGCQFNVTVPNNAFNGSLPILLDIGGVSTQAAQPDVNIPVQAVSTGLASILVSYRLDPWLIGGTYTGGIWASPPVLGPVNQGASTFTLETIAQGYDAQSQPVSASPRWIASDPGMVAMTQAQGNRVTITVLRDGASTLQVSADSVSRILSIKASSQNGVMEVVIAQN